jgi:ankyrin repeat protein
MNTTAQEETNSKSCLSFNFFYDRSASDASFLALAKDRRFNEILNFLPHASDSWLAVRRRDGSVSTSETLHAILMYKPNAEVVKALLDRLASDKLVDPLLRLDPHGRNPLHIAVAKGCDFTIIQLLLSPSAVNARDYDGRFPLHWACVNTSPSRSFLNRRAVRNSIRIVSKLIECSPEVVTMRDAHGETALDLAMRYSLDRRIINVLRLASCKTKAQTSTVESSEDDSSGLDIPLEICNYDNDDDDLSSVGFRGVSYHRRRVVHQHPPMGQLMFIHEVVEL